MLPLSSEQRHFFKAVAAIAFVNPFSKEREKADCELLHCKIGQYDIFQRNDLIQQQLREQFALLNCKSCFKLNQLSADMQEPVKWAWLFFQYHEFQADFNHLMEKQSVQKETDADLSFTHVLSERFLLAGFSVMDTERFIALFYQLQRGFYFINSALAGHSESVIQLRVHLWNSIFTFNPRWYLQYLFGKLEDFSTLLLGETGTGKSRVARAIGCSGLIPFDLSKHQFKVNFIQSFQSINLSQYPASLLESELFGHKKGAFTGAIDHHQGVFARCSAHGAVFIDEIGEIDIPTQVKLLNVIQDRVFSPVGSHDSLRFSGRVISATNRNIDQLRQKGGFRDDLYYRLCSDVIHIPGLKQRLQEYPEELECLVFSLLQQVIKKPEADQVNRLTQQIRRCVPADYAWPGNIRELEQCIRRLCLTGQYLVDYAADDQANEVMFKLEAANLEVSAQSLLQQYCCFLYEKYRNYEAVARITQLDRRTVKKHIGNR